MRSARFDKQKFITFVLLSPICYMQRLPISISNAKRNCDSFCRSVFEVLQNVSTCLHTVI
jgi:hypothetical protein